MFLFVPSRFADLKARGLKLGVISNTGDEKGQAVRAILAPTGLLTNLDPSHLVYSRDEPPIVDDTSGPPIITRVTKRILEIRPLQWPTSLPLTTGGIDACNP